MSVSPAFRRSFAVIAFFAVVALVAGGCANTGGVPRDKYEHDVSALKVQNDSLTRRNVDLEQLRLTMELQIKAKQRELEDMERRLQNLTLDGTVSAEIQKALAALNQPGLTYNAQTGAWELQEELLFQPGKNIIRQSGEEILAKLAGAYKDQNCNLVIVGHTDDTPIKVSLDENPTGLNLELGARRAVAVADRLAKSGIPETRMWVISYGQNRPKTNGDGTTGNKKECRRVEIYVVKGS